MITKSFQPKFFQNVILLFSNMSSTAQTRYDNFEKIGSGTYGMFILFHPCHHYQCHIDCAVFFLNFKSFSFILTTYIISLNYSQVTPNYQITHTILILSKYSPILRKSLFDVVIIAFSLKLFLSSFYFIQFSPLQHTFTLIFTHIHSPVTIIIYTINTTTTNNNQQQPLPLPHTHTRLLLGVVFRATDTSSGKVVAIKKLKPDQEDEGISSTTIREISLLKELTHANIISLLEVNYTDNKLCLVFEYLDRDLSVYLSEVQGLLSPQILKVCFSHLLLDYLFVILSSLLLLIPCCLSPLAAYLPR